ncbi:MAG: DegV family protein [Clostridiales bacterium]|jgi:DegV family protein with EDD domain|nr:DegV family protein [Clostridiales bacterium]
MRDYTIFTDSTCDLTPEMYAENGLECLRMVFTVSGRDYEDDCVTLAGHDFYQLMRAGAMPTTTQINPDTIISRLSAQLDQGRDVIYLVFSSALSGTYQNACLAVSDLRSRYPDAKIYAVDSTSQCGGEGRLALAMAQKKREGMDIDTLYRWTEENKKYFIHYFTVDDLNYLYRGGRLSRTAAIAGSMLGIKPVMYTALDGKLTVGSKVRGRRASLQMIVDRMVENIVEPEKQLVLINHADCPADAEWMKQEVLKRVKVRDLKILPLGPTIGSHVGPGCIALFFTGKTRAWR